MLAPILLLLWCAHLLAPATPIGRAIRHAMVVAPAAWLARITRGQVMLTILLIIVVGGLMWWQREALNVFAMAGPDIAAFLSTFEITTLLDIGAAALATATAVRVRRLDVRLVARPRGSPRRRARHPRPSRIEPANDESDSSCPSRAA